ncbi:MAG: hypothetical protein K8F90_02825 [Hyphomicrobiales bacterium]|nr:hypothetical protein [Hyphomicrobiales bacterium]
MLERRSALASVYTPGPLGARNGASPLVIHERSNRDLVQVSGWPESFAAVCATLGRLLKLAMPNDCRNAALGNGRTVFRVGPERIWAAGEAADGALQTISMSALGGDAVVTEIGHSRTVIRIGGAEGRTLLNRGLPIDLDEPVFPENAFVQSIIHHIPVLVHRVPSTGGLVFDIYVPREYAVSFWECLLEAACALGCRIEVRQ